MFMSWLIISLVTLCIFDQSKGLDKLPDVEDNDIVKTEAVIRRTTNELFDTFALRYAHSHPQIKQFSTIHKYFISLTLQDYNSLKEIAQLTRVDKNKIGKVITNFITLLNEVLDEDGLIGIEHALNGEVEGSYDITNELSKIEYLKNLHMNPGTILEINSQILKILEEDASAESFNMNTTLDAPLLYLEDDTVSDDDGLWRANGTVQRPTRRIFGGYTTKIDHYAFLASVQIFGKFQCGSTIIKSDLVVTAASCLQLAWNNRFYRENPAFLSVRVGSSFYESGGESIAALEIYFYPAFKPRNLNHNIAIIRTVRHVYWKKRVKRIEIDTQENPTPMNVDGVLIVGWGAKTASNKLQTAFRNKIHYSLLDIYPLHECQQIYSKDYVTKRHFCAGFASKGNGACNRDVGGPGVIAGMLAGIISFGSPVCGTPDAPTVFTKVGYYTDWIEDILEKDVPNSKKKTTKAPTEYLYLPEVTRRHPVRPWSVVPVTPKHNTVTTQATVTVNEPQDHNKKEVHKKEKQMFKQFLKTMFNSDEIQEYFDTVKETFPPVLLSKTSLFPRTPSMDFTTATIKSPELLQNTQQPKTATRIQSFNTLAPKSSENYEDSDTDEGLRLANIAEREQRSTTQMDRQGTATSFDDTDSGPELVQDLAISDTNDPAFINSVETKGDNMEANDPDKDLEERILSIVKDIARSSEHLTTVQVKELRYKNNDESLESKRDSEANETLIDTINQVVLSLLNIPEEQNKNKVVPSQPSADNSEDAELQRESQESKINIEPLREHKKPPANYELKSSSDYESESVELVIPVRTTSILEMFTYSQTTPYAEFNLPEVVPKKILPKGHRKKKHREDTLKIRDMPDTLHISLLPNMSIEPNVPKILNMPSFQWPLEPITTSLPIQSERPALKKKHRVKHRPREPSETEDDTPKYHKAPKYIENSDPEDPISQTKQLDSVKEWTLDEAKNSIETKKFQKKMFSELRNLYANVVEENEKSANNKGDSGLRIEQNPVTQTIGPTVFSENEDNKQAPVKINEKPLDEYLGDIISKYNPAKQEPEKYKSDDEETQTEKPFNPMFQISTVPPSSTFATYDDYGNNSYVASYDLMLEPRSKYHVKRRRVH